MILSGRTVLTDGGTLRQYPPWTRVDRLSTDTSPAYLEFAALWQTRDPHQITAFCDRFGLLGLERRRQVDGLVALGAPMLRSDDPPESDVSLASDEATMDVMMTRVIKAILQSAIASRGWKDARTKELVQMISKSFDQSSVDESLDEFLAESRCMSRLLSLWQTISNGNHQEIRGLFEASTQEEGSRLSDFTVRIYSEPLLELPADTDRESLTRKVWNEIGAMIHSRIEGRVSPTLSLGGSQVNFEFTPDDLLAALYWQVAQDLGGHSLPPRICADETCAKWFLPGRPDKKYCSYECNTRHRQRVYQRRRRDKQRQVRG